MLFQHPPHHRSLPIPEHINSKYINISFICCSNTLPCIIHCRYLNTLTVNILISVLYAVPTPSPASFTADT